MEFLTPPRLVHCRSNSNTTFIAMRWFQAYNFFDSVRPVYLATRIFQIHFETLDFEKQTVHRTLLDQFLFVLTVLVDFYLFYRGLITSLPYLELTDSVLLNVGSYASLVLLVLFSSTLVLWNRCKTDGVIEIYRNVANCDRQLQSLGIMIDHRKYYLINTVCVFATILISVTILIGAIVFRYNETWIQISLTQPDFITILNVHRTTICFSMFICYNNLMLLALGERFDRVREAMM